MGGSFSFTKSLLLQLEIESSNKIKIQKSKIFTKKS